MWARAVFLAAALLSSAASISRPDAQPGWAVYVDAHFAYRLGYPQDVFLPQAPGQTPDTVRFATADGTGRLTAFAGLNEGNLSLLEYRATVLKEFAGYDNVTYGPVAPTWFVLSGFRGDEIYYQKVIFACGGRVVNVFALKYPAREKLRYDPIVTGIAREFRPASAADCDKPMR